MGGFFDISPAFRLHACTAAPLCNLFPLCDQRSGQPGQSFKIFSILSDIWDHLTLLSRFSALNLLLMEAFKGLSCLKNNDCKRGDKYILGNLLISTLMKNRIWLVTLAKMKISFTYVRNLYFKYVPRGFYIWKCRKMVDF